MADIFQSNLSAKTNVIIGCRSINSYFRPTFKLGHINEIVWWLNFDLIQLWQMEQETIRFLSIFYADVMCFKIAFPVWMGIPWYGCNFPRKENWLIFWKIFNPSVCVWVCVDGAGELRVVFLHSARQYEEQWWLTDGSSGELTVRGWRRERENMWD